MDTLKDFSCADDALRQLHNEERQTVCGVRDLVTVARINGKLVSGKEYYLHMAKLAEALEEVNVTGQGSSA